MLELSLLTPSPALAEEKASTLYLDRNDATWENLIPFVRRVREEEQVPRFQVSLQLVFFLDHVCPSSADGSGQGPTSCPWPLPGAYWFVIWLLVCSGSS